MRAATLIVSGKFTSGAEELSAEEELSVEELSVFDELELSVVEELELPEELVELVELPEQALNVSAHIAAIRAALNLFLIFIEYLLSFGGLARFFL